MQKNLQSSNQPPIQFLVGLLQSGQFELLAIKAHECAIRWPRSGHVWHIFGLAQLNLGRSSDAIASLTKARKLLPAELEIVELLASALLQAGRIQEAYKAFEFHLARSPGNLSDLINLGHLANDLGHHGNAEQHCRQVLRLAPEQAEAVFNS